MKKLLLTLALFLLPLTAFAANCSSLTDHIVAYYKFDGNSNDSVGSANGTDHTITYSNANGIINNGAGFNGTSSYIQVPGQTWTSTMSISLWVFGTWANGNFIMDSTAGAARTYIWNPAADSNLQVSIHNTAATTFTSILTASAWNHIVFIADGSNVTAYKNGSSFGTQTMSLSGSQTPTNSYFATDNAQSTFGVTKLDEIGIWNCTLTSAQVTSLYNGGAGLQYPFSSAAAATPIINWVEQWWRII